MEVLNSLKSVHYNFLYRKMSDIIVNHESQGNTQVRFVSRALRGKNDSRYRHVSLEFMDHNTGRFKVSEKYSLSLSNEWRDEFCIGLPNVHWTIEEIEDFESNIPNMYIIGLMDCRHHVSDMLRMCYFSGSN